MAISKIWGSFTYTIFCHGRRVMCHRLHIGILWIVRLRFQWMHFLWLRAKATEPAVFRVQCRSRYFPRNGRRELSQKTPLFTIGTTLVSRTISGDSGAIIYGSFLEGLVVYDFMVVSIVLKCVRIIKLVHSDWDDPRVLRLDSLKPPTIVVAAVDIYPCAGMCQDFGHTCTTALGHFS